VSVDTLACPFFSVPAINWREVRPYLEMSHFRKEIIERKNMAAAGLCAWVINIVIYHDILVRVGYYVDMFLLAVASAFAYDCLIRLALVVFRRRLVPNERR
jgi:hypothetical protein